MTPAGAGAATRGLTPRSGDFFANGVTFQAAFFPFSFLLPFLKKNVSRLSWQLRRVKKKKILSAVLIAYFIKTAALQQCEREKYSQKSELSERE